MKKAIPNTEAAKKAMQNIEAYNEAMACVDRIISSYGEFPMLNCANHLLVTNADTRSEVNASSCTDMDTTTMADDPEQDTKRRKYKRS
ncbi:hypothetical protein AVEN_270078-1 [Araneus ventricosus]|uniref:Uncharacterized protein n=1 Tax=Araneus ventricosus TaxID=182803 RepID=A0A4Y2VP86_ARAVE|nr:hypothetical protein AVEN_270078-1 [Araneus ventricosus]